MSDVLSLIGGLFIISSIAISAGGFYELRKNNEKVTEAGLYKALAIASIFVWILIGLGAVTWIISLIYTNGLDFFYWIYHQLAQ